MCSSLTDCQTNSNLCHFIDHMSINRNNLQMNHPFPSLCYQAGGKSAACPSYHRAKVAYAIDSEGMGLYSISGK